MKDTNKIICNQRHQYQHGKKISKEESIKREHSKTHLRQAKLNFFFSKGDSNGHSGRMEDKNHAITDAEKGCVNGTKNFYDDPGGVINNDLNIHGENNSGEYYK